MNRRVMLLVPVIAGAELGAAYALAVLPGWRGPLAASALHVAAALLCRWAARLRRDDLSVVETDIVVWIALLVPVFGPVLGWAAPRPPATEDAENAHVVFEQYAEHVKPADAGYERTVFTGDFKRDLARELDVESYHEVLRHGETDQKRNALRRLAELGEPKHFDLIRSCLLDPSHEVRLYAYSELERAGRDYEEEIANRSRQLKKQPDNVEALLTLARTYHRYAASGILDPSMAAFYFRSAERYATQAQQHGADDPEAAFVRAAALGRLEEYEDAEACLQALPEPHQALPGCCLVRAEIAYRRRDFAKVREEAARFLETDAEPPPWLAAIGGKREVQS
jgi:hypothetical protein